MWNFMSKTNSSFTSRERYNFEMKYALKDQMAYHEKRKKEIKGYALHGGLGWTFIEKLKIALFIFIILAFVTGAYIFILQPQLKGAYSFSVLSLSLLFCIAYLRKKIDDRLL